MMVIISLGIILAVLAYFVVRVRWYKQGLAYVNEGQLDDAIRIFSRVIKFYPQDALALYHRALVYRRKGNDVATLADYDQAVARGGRMSGAILGARAFFLMYLGRYEDALADYQLALKADPNQPQAQLGVAYAYVFMKDYENALQMAQVAVDDLEKQMATNEKYGAYILANSPEKDAQLANVYISVYAAKALALIHLGRGDEAKAIYVDLAEKFPNSMIFYTDRAEINFLLGDYDTAIADYEKALALAVDSDILPTSSGYDLSYLAQAGYAVTLFASGNIEKAHAQWRDLQAKAPLLSDAKQVSKEFFWSEAMTHQADQLMVSLNA